MARDVAFLDTGPLGLACANPSSTLDVQRINANLIAWQAQAIVVLPAITDYELRRELVRRRATRAIRWLDYLRGSLYYLPINTEAIDLAAELWAQARQSGRATADDTALDGDVILAAQARAFTGIGDRLVVITDNNRHLGHFVNTSTWAAYTPQRPPTP